MVLGGHKDRCVLDRQVRRSIHKELRKGRIMEQRLFRCRYCKERVPLEELRVRISQVCKQKSSVSDYFEEYKVRVIQCGKMALKR